jgi:hypothetical protein
MPSLNPHAVYLYRIQVRKIAMYGSGPVQLLAKVVIEDQGRLETIIGSLQKIPDVHDPANRVHFAAMTEIEYSSLRNRIEQLCLIQQQLDERIEDNMEKVTNHSEIARQLRKQEASTVELEMFGLKSIQEEPDEEERSNANLEMSLPDAQILVRDAVQAMESNQTEVLDLSKTKLTSDHLPTCLMPMLTIGNAGVGKLILDSLPLQQVNSLAHSLATVHVVTFVFVLPFPHSHTITHSLTLTLTHSHTHTLTLTPHSLTHSHTLTHSHIHTFTHSHTHTHLQVGIVALVEALLGNREVRTLSLERCCLGPQSPFSKLLKNNSYLSELNLARNDLGVKGAVNLASGLKRNRGLVVLNLRSNYIARVHTAPLVHYYVHYYTTLSLRPLTYAFRTPGVDEGGAGDCE